MTVNDYISQKFQTFGINLSETDLLEISLSSEVSGEDETMHLFAMSRAERNRCLTIINDYYRLHLPNFPLLKSLDVLKELFA